MTAVALWVWGAALVVAAVVLGFAAYELGWKLRRVRRDAARLAAVLAGSAAVRGELDTARRTLAAVAGARAEQAARRGPTPPWATDQLARTLRRQHAGAAASAAGAAASGTAGGTATSGPDAAAGGTPASTGARAAGGVA